MSAPYDRDTVTLRLPAEALQERRPPRPPGPASPGPAPSGIGRSSALMAAGTIVSRITGFARTLVMAASYGLGYAFGVGIAWRRLRRRLGGDLDGGRVLRTYARLITASLPAALAAGAVAYVLTRELGSGALPSLLSLTAGGTALLLVFLAMARLLRVPELTALTSMVRKRLGR